MSPFVIRRESTVQYVNTFAAEQFGKKPQDLIGQSLEALFPPEIASHFKSSLQEALASGKPRYVVQKSAFPGRAVWLYSHLVPLRDDVGTVTAVLGTAHDVTESKWAEERLRDKVAALQTLAEIEQAITSTLSLSERMDILLEHTLTHTAD